MTEINVETGKLLASEMNAKYPAMVYAMTKQVGEIPAGSKITSCKVIAVRNKECEISYVTCRGDACSMPKKVVYSFNPPLEDKVYMLRLQSQICAPKWHWLVTKPLALFILIICTGLSILALGFGVRGMLAALEKAPRLEQGAATIFGSAENFALAVVGAWIFAVFAHFVESLMAYRYCEQILRFSNAHSSMWALLVFFVGWPIFKELQELVAAKEAHSKTK